MPAGLRIPSAERTQFADPQELFDEQDGVAAVWQLVALGLPASTARNWVAQRRLYRLYHGVYARVPPQQLKPKGHWMAAVLACGRYALLSHRSAARALELRNTLRSRIDVSTTRGSAGRGIKGIDAHQLRNLTDDDIVYLGALPTTSIARTVLDLAAVTDRRTTERAIEQAIVSDRFDLRAFEDVLERNQTHRGAAHVTTILDGLRTNPKSTQTESPLAEAFLMLIREAGLPEPETEQYIILPTGDVFRADFLWREERVIVETDGRKTHMNPVAFQNDRTRDQLLSAHDWRPLRFTDHDVRVESARTVRTVCAVLDLRRGRAGYATLNA